MPSAKDFVPSSPIEFQLCALVSLLWGGMNVYITPTNQLDTERFFLLNAIAAGGVLTTYTLYKSGKYLASWCSSKGSEKPKEEDEDRHINFRRNNEMVFFDQNDPTITV